jgi:hypothetical protein
MKIEVSNGEIFDKHTILKIKLERIKDAAKLKNVLHEYEVLTPSVDKIFKNSKNLRELAKAYDDMYEVNQSLWNIEDLIRDCERAEDFGETFIQLARSVYWTNDDRNLVKKRIDSLTGSALTEEKSYAKYKNK